MEAKTASAEVYSKREKRLERVLVDEIKMMLSNPNPLTGIYSIYGDYPIEKWNSERSAKKKLERMYVAR